MSQTLTIVGASVRAAAQSALRGGMLVQAADLFADVDLACICQTTRVADYPAGLGAIIGGSQPDGWMYTGALENHPALVSRWARLRKLWGNGGAGLRRVRDPRRVLRAVRAAGLVAPDLAPAGEVPPRDELWLRKPLRSAAGSRVVRWDSDACDAPSGTRWYFQEYVEGAACAAVYVAAGGRAALLGVTRQLIGQPWCGANGFRYCGSIGPIECSAAAMQNFAELGTVLARDLELVGLFGIDAIVNAQGVWPVEVNPRYTASTELLDWALGISAVELHVTACQHGRLPRELPAARRVCGKAIIFAPRALHVDTTWDELRRTADDGWPALADIPAAGARIEAGWPIVTVLAAGSSEDEVLEKLHHQASDVRRTVGLA